MIKLIGAKRLMIIAILAGACVVMGGASFMLIKPQNEKVDRELRQLRSDISFKRSETNRFREEMTEIQNEKNTFQSLQSLGFLGEQSRLEARKRIEAIQSYSRVLSARYNIAPGKVENAETATEADQVLLTTEIAIEIDALDDADVYKFISLMENAFIGHVSVTSLELDRVLDLNEVTLRQIGSGIPAVLVRAKLVLNWKTLLSRQQAMLIGAGTAPTEGM